MNEKHFQVGMMKGAAAEGAFEGLASVYGNVDLDGEVVQRGAFTKTLAERGSRVVLLWQHDKDRPIGVGRLEDTNAGLKVYGQLSMGSTWGREAYHLMKDGVLDQFSIGYETIKSKTVAGVRHLTELKLWEVSLVTFPANTAALLESIKGADFDAESLRQMSVLTDDIRRYLDDLDGDDGIMRGLRDLAACMSGGAR